MGVINVMDDMLIQFKESCMLKLSSSLRKGTVGYGFFHCQILHELIQTFLNGFNALLKDKQKNTFKRKLTMTCKIALFSLMPLLKIKIKQLLSNVG